MTDLKDDFFKNLNEMKFPKVFHLLDPDSSYID